MAGKLYVVPTPVGNLGDMSPRAIEVLKQSDLILAEDTRTSGTLMKNFGITTPMASHHKFNEHATVGRIAERLKGGETIALVSDAGTPAISDPGFMLVRECAAAGIDVETLPGPTAFVPALVNSGLPCDRFLFEGFLPVKKGRSTRLSELAASPTTFIVYESPLRLARTLAELSDACCADRPASVSREISKLHDTTVRGTLGTLASYFEENQARGEIVIVVGGCSSVSKKEKRVHTNKYRKDTDDTSKVSDVS